MNSLFPCSLPPHSSPTLIPGFHLCLSSFYLLLYYCLSRVHPASSSLLNLPALFLSSPKHHPNPKPTPPHVARGVLYHFWQCILKDMWIYANLWLKNEHSLPCKVQKKGETHYNIFLLLWICRIIIKNDLWSEQTLCFPSPMWLNKAEDFTRSQTVVERSQWLHF